MIRQPVYIRTFGNLKITIWSYRKEILRSLLVGLKQNSNTLNRVTEVAGFRHCEYECMGGCNCAEEVEELCHRYSVNAQRYGKVYVPLEVVDCEGSLRPVFICELRSEVTTKGPRREAGCMNVVSDDIADGRSCLLRLSLDRPACEVTRDCEQKSKTDTKLIKRCYERLIRELVQIRTCNSSEGGPIDRARVLDLCCLVGMPTEETMTLLRDLQDVQNPSSDPLASLCRPCENQLGPKMSGTEQFQRDNGCIPTIQNNVAEEQNKMATLSYPTIASTGNNNRNFCTPPPQQCCSHKQQQRKFRLARSPSPKKCSSCREDESDCSRSPSPEVAFSDDCGNDRVVELCQAVNSKPRRGGGNRWAHRMAPTLIPSTSGGNNDSEPLQRDLVEIKGILKDLVSVLNCEAPQTPCAPTASVKPECSEPPNRDSTIDLLNCILNELKTKNPGRLECEEIPKTEKVSEVCVPVCPPKDTSCCLVPSCKDSCCPPRLKDPYKQQVPTCGCVPPIFSGDPCTPCCSSSSQQQQQQKHQQHVDPSQDDSRIHIYRYLPLKIPVIPELKDGDMVPTLDAYEMCDKTTRPVCPQTPPCPPNSKVAKTGATQASSDKTAQCDIIKNALESAGVPKNISEKISRIAPIHGSTGVTNIYYYVGSNDSKKQKSTGTGSVSGQRISVKSDTPPDFIVEHQRIGGKPDPHSHIVVDINNIQHPQQPHGATTSQHIDVADSPGHQSHSITPPSSNRKSGSKEEK